VVIEALVLQLIAETWRRKTALADPHPRWLRHAEEFLREQFAQPLTLAAVAQSAGVHPVYLASSFRRHYGCSIGDYVRRCRVEFASREISTSQASLAEVALAAGFSNQSHFTRVFSQITGMSPARYRRAFRRS
jgi:AraC family transcriptional regulator